MKRGAASHWSAESKADRCWVSLVQVSLEDAQDLLDGGKARPSKGGQVQSSCRQLACTCMLQHGMSKCMLMGTAAHEDKADLSMQQVLVNKHNSFSY